MKFKIDDSGMLLDTGFIRELYQESGFSTNPEQRLDDSRLLMTLTGQKNTRQ